MLGENSAGDLFRPVRGHRTERGDDPAVSGPSLASLLASWQAIQAGNPGAIGTGERCSVTVRRAIIQRVAKVRSVHDRARYIAAVVSLPQRWRTRRGFPPGGIGSRDRVIPPTGFGDPVATPAQRDPR